MASDQRQLWNEFLDKCEFVFLTDHPSGVPFPWLDELADFHPEDRHEADLLDKLKAGEPEQFRSTFAEFIEKRQPQSLVKAPAVDLELILGDPTREPGDVLIAAHDSGYEDRYIVAAAGPDHARRLELHPPAEPELFPPGELPVRHLVMVPRLETRQTRQLRRACKRALALAHRQGPRTILLNHLPSMDPTLPDSFSSAEVVSVAREFLLAHPGLKIRIIVFSRRVYAHYRYWMQALHSIRRREPSLDSSPGPATIRPQPPLERPEERVPHDEKPGPGLVQNLTRHLRESRLGSLLAHTERSSAPDHRFEIGQALAQLELGYHDQARQVLEKLRRQHPESLQPDFLLTVVHFDGYVRTGDESDLILARAGASRLRQACGLYGVGLAQAEILLGLCHLETGEADRAKALLAAACVRLEETDSTAARELHKVCHRLHHEEALNPHYRGTPAPEREGESLTIPLFLNLIARG